MFNHLLTILWNNRRNNMWLIGGLCVITVSLWYSVDYIYTVVANQNKSLGFDWHHVYKVNIGALTSESRRFNAEPDHIKAGNDLIIFLNRLEQHPAVEFVCLTDMHKHYQWTNMQVMLKVDTLTTGAWYRIVSQDYFNVFRVNGADGSSPEMLASKANFTDWILTKEAADRLFPNGDATHKTIYNAYSGDSIRISAITEHQKYNEYTSQQPAAYQILNLNDLRDVNYVSVPYYGCYVRVRPEADTDDFIRAFRKDMRTQLMIGNLYLKDIQPMSVIRDEHLKDSRNEVYTYITVIIFFLLNAFLAVLGTFWSRTQQRRSELALRLALGSTKAKNSTLLHYEGISLLTVAFLFAMLLICNLAMAGLISTWPIGFSAKRLILSSFITYGLLVLIVWFAIWYPSRQALKIQPAEALHEE